MVATLINARLNNSPELSPGEHQSNEAGGSTVVHHHHHGRWRGPRWRFVWRDSGRHRRHGGNGWQYSDGTRLLQRVQDNAAVIPKPGGVEIYFNLNNLK